MMDFFRKYERPFLITITCVIIASFMFFGANSTFNDAPQREDRMVARAVDGSKLMRSEIERLSRFIATDRWDQGETPNFCNDGVIRFDLLKTGIAEAMVARYFEPMKKSFENRLERVKRFRSYVHPEAPFLSAVSVWDRFVPGLNGAITELQKEEAVSSKTFAHLVQLYELESRCPQEWLRKLLMFQQQQYTWLKPDPRLERGDLALFGFHSPSDWFGSDFLDLCSEFILNSARFAEKKGCRVSIEEAKADLINQYSFTVKKIKESNPQREVLDFHSHLRVLGFDEKSAAETWRNVLLFRRYFQGVGQAVFIDRLPYSDFASYALETAHIELYQWPSALRLKTFSDLLQLQFYIGAVSKVSSLDLPTQVLPLDQVELTHPELVQTTYSAKIAKASTEEIGLRASVKEVWDWQLDENHWETLRKEFSFLKNGSSREERFQVLEALSAQDRGSLDAHTRKILVAAHPEWLDRVLSGAGNDQEIQISRGWCSLSSIRRPEGFAASLETSYLTQMPMRYSDDESTHFQLSDVKILREKHLLTFEEAKMQGIVDRQLLAELEKKYPEVRSRFAEKFKSEDGKWKSFHEVKDLVGSYVYDDLLKEIDRLDPQAEASLESYVARRLLPQTRKALETLNRDPADSQWIYSENGDPLIEQFKLEKNDTQVQRIGKDEWMKDEALAYFPNQWSPIHVSTDGISFFYFKEKRANLTPILEQLVMGKETIAADAQRFLAESMLNNMLRNESIVIPIKGEIE